MSNLKSKGILNGILILFIVLITAPSSFAEKPAAKKIMFFGDSTTGWLAERLQAYGDKNGFEVATLVWDGATMKKYANNAEKLKQHIASAKPDAVFVSLGMNEMAATNPEAQLGSYLQKIKNTIGDIPIIWVGPVSWPGHTTWGPALDKWLASELGEGSYFSSLGLILPRQSKTNPHPTRAGANKWTDALMEWIKEGHSAIALPGYSAPAKEFSRPSNYVYKKMSAPL